MANVIDAEYKKIEGVYVLAESQYRKCVREQPVLTCENCNKRHGDNGVEVKRCSGACLQFSSVYPAINNSLALLLQCLSVAFCSRECQRQFWPEHKESCKGLEVALILEDLVRHFLEDPFLLHFLRVALIFKLGLQPLQSSNKNPPRTIIFETVHVHIFPIAEKDIVGLVRRGPPPPQQKIPGFMIVGLNMRERAQYIPIVGGPKFYVRQYIQGRAEAGKNGRKENPVILVQFGYDGEAMVYGIEITADAFKTASGNIPEGIIPSAIKDEAEARKPFTIQSCLGLMRTYVEKDHENELKLRRNLRTADMQYIRSS